MGKIHLLILPLILAASYVFAGERPPISEGETLDVERCVEIALPAHPSVVSAESNAAAARSRISQSESNYYPQVEVSSDYSRVDGDSLTGPRNEYSNAVRMRQNLYDFGR